MKRDMDNVHKDWPRWTPLAVFGLIACVILFVLAVDVLPASFTPPYRWGDGVDSAKLFITLADGTHWDSTAGAARTECARYDSTITGLSNDTGYIVICRIWDADSGKDWTFYWPLIYRGTGSGSNAVRIYAIDTSGTDDSIMSVNITVRTITGVYYASGLTNSNGYRDFELPTDSMTYIGSRVGYRFILDTVNVIDNDTVDVCGYNIPLQASPEPNLCRVQGYVYIPEGAPKKKITVTFTVDSDAAVHNSCDATAFIAEAVTAKTSVHADSLGFFYKDLVPSGCLLKADGDSLQYKVTQELDGVKGKEEYIWVPQEESYEIVW